ncbi:acyl-CoA thioesterase [Roseibium marinum]|uniref:Acyl-CoA thioester hydrolase n=1 Tax=Roseibium marinum TaxID=281252 RepID=A0A2S3UQT7_9HYPH|nr:thioesterase family protein [Roseibium marinum]POF30077.1 acyl-CoA thioester hydrolase [Roseibium marinum]
MTVARAAEAGIEAFPLRTSDKLRYGDTDRQGHVNNAVFATFLETGRVELLYREALAEDGAAFVIARLELDFLAEINWPGDVEIGTAVSEVGRSSFRLFQCVFQDGVPVARAVTVVVQMNEATRKSQPLSDNARQRLETLVSSAAGT